ARAIAAVLQELGLEGERVILLHPPGLEYVASFFGCLFARVSAVPAYPPDLSRLERSLPRLRAVGRDSSAAAVLRLGAIPAMARGFGARARELADLRWLASDEVDDAMADRWQPPPVTGRDIAFFQYTSGSTGNPRGVMVSHRNLLHNSAQVSRYFVHSRSSRM